MESFVGININYLEEPMVPIRYLIRKVRDSRRRNIKKAHSIAKLRVKINLVCLRYLRGGFSAGIFRVGRLGPCALD